MLMCAVIGGIITAVYVSGQDFSSQELSEKYRILCDGFTIPGFFLLSFGALVFASNEGALDGIGFIVGKAVRALIPVGRLRDRESFYDYIQRKRANRVTGYSFMLWTGAVFMAVALVFLALYYGAVS